MKKETYFCDKCKKQVEKKTDLSSVAIGTERTYVDSNYFIPTKQFDLCDLCCAKLGIIKQVLTEGKLVNEPQDIKDRLYDIFVDLVNECHE